jgi:hypothetical protein
MRFMCLVYIERGLLEAMPADQFTALSDASIEGDHRLAATGKLVGGAPLQGEETAVSVRARDGEMIVTDGPFMETKEWLAGYFMLDVADMAEAVAIVRQGTPVGGGHVEIRPVLEQVHSVTGVKRPF